MRAPSSRGVEPGPPAYPPDYMKAGTQSLSRKAYTLGGWRGGGRSLEGGWRGGAGGRSLDYASDTDAVQSPPRSVKIFFF